jgi:glycosyltransferase involved in cell wall biosynthesis
MRLGIVLSPKDTWHFFNEIHEDLKSHYEVDVFQFESTKSPIFYDRINRGLFNRQLRTFLKTHDVVFFEWVSDWLAIASMYPKECQIVTRLHRYEMYHWADKINWEVVDKIILVSRAKKQEFVDRFPKQAEKTEVIPVAIDLDKFQLTQRKFNGDIGILCNLIPRKRVYELILYFYELTNLRDGLHLHIGGGEREFFLDYHVAIKKLIERLNLEDNITLYGKVTAPERWYQNIDIFVSNSYSEGLQVAPMEAMASGCYCLSHRWDGVEELLPEENLFYTEREFQDKILGYCDYSEEEKQLQRELMRTHALENFNLENTIIKIRALIEEVGAK